MTDDMGAHRHMLMLTSGLVLIGTVGAAVVASGLDAITVVFWRSFIGAAFLIVWGLARGILPDRTLTKRKVALSLIAGSSLVISWAAFFAGIAMTSISTATILFHVQPFLILLLSAAIWKEKVSRSQIGWLVAAFIGVTLASGLSLTGGSGASDDWTLGVVITLAGACIYAVTAVAGKGLQDQRGEVTTLFQTVAGSLLFLPFVDLTQHIALESWMWLIVIGVVQTGVAWVLLYSAFPFVSAPMTAVLSFVNPLTAIATDWVFFGHLLTPWQALGMVVIVLSTLGMKFGGQLRRG